MNAVLNARQETQLNELNQLNNDSIDHYLKNNADSLYFPFHYVQGNVSKFSDIEIVIFRDAVHRALSNIVHLKQVSPEIVNDVITSLEDLLIVLG